MNVIHACPACPWTFEAPANSAEATARFNKHWLLAHPELDVRKPIWPKGVDR